MRDPTQDDRVLFVIASSLVILFLWQIQDELSSPIFWTVVVLWVLIVVAMMKVKNRLLKADTWTMSVKLEMFTSKTAFWVLFVAIVVMSPLAPLFIGIRVRGLESIRYSGFVGGMIGLDFSIVRGWLRRRNHNE